MASGAKRNKQNTSFYAWHLFLPEIWTQYNSIKTFYPAEKEKIDSIITYVNSYFESDHTPALRKALSDRISHIKHIKSDEQRIPVPALKTTENHVSPARKKVKNSTSISSSPKVLSSSKISSLKMSSSPQLPLSPKASSSPTRICDSDVSNDE